MRQRQQSGQRRPRRQRRQSERGGISPVAFHRLTSVALSGVTGTSSFNLSPNGSVLSGLAEVADQFDLFRVSDLDYRIHPMSPSNTANQVLMYVPDVDIQTQTTSQASESPISAVQGIFSGVPSSWIRVPRSQLKGMLDWYKCTADAGAAEFESQGILQAVGGLSETMLFEVRGVVLFKNPVSTALQFARAIDRAVAAGTVVRIPSTHDGSSAAKSVTPKKTIS